MAMAIVAWSQSSKHSYKNNKANGDVIPPLTQCSVGSLSSNAAKSINFNGKISLIGSVDVSLMQQSQAIHPLSQSSSNHHNLAIMTSLSHKSKPRDSLYS